MDGLVLARCAFSHSMNYRASCSTGGPRGHRPRRAPRRGAGRSPATSLPGREDEAGCRRPTSSARRSCSSIPLDEACAKVRTGRRWTTRPTSPRRSGRGPAARHGRRGARGRTRSHGRDRSSRPTCAVPNGPSQARHTRPDPWYPYVGSLYRSDISIAIPRTGRYGSNVLELAILGLLKEQPMHGYQLSRELGGAARRALAGLLRLALPDPAAPRARRRGGERPGDAAGRAGARPSTASPRRASGSSCGCSRSRRTRARPRTRGSASGWRSSATCPPETRIRLLDRRRAALEERLDQHQGRDPRGHRRRATTTSAR